MGKLKVRLKALQVLQTADDVVKYDDLCMKTFGYCDKCARNTMRVIIHRLRNMGHDIRSLNGVGYFIPRDTEMCIDVATLILEDDDFMWNYPEKDVIQAKNVVLKELKSLKRDV